MEDIEATAAVTGGQPRIELRATFEWTASRDSETIASQSAKPPVPEVPGPALGQEKKPMTVGISTSLEKRAETAVLQMQGYEGGYLSMSALVEGALERELERLAAALNADVPFSENIGAFRQGRPFNS